MELLERAPLDPLTTLEKNAPKYTMLPNFAKGRHVAVEKRLLALGARSEVIPVNRIEMGDPRVGIVASGASYVYARERFRGQLSQAGHELSTARGIAARVP